MRATMYLTVNGMIVGDGEFHELPAPSATRSYIAAGGAFGDDPNTHYVLAGEITARPANPASLDTASIDADGLDTATIAGIEAGARVTVTDANGQATYVVTDGAIELTSEEPGAIRIDVQGVFPTLDKAFTVTAT